MNEEIDEVIEDEIDESKVEESEAETSTAEENTEEKIEFTDQQQAHLNKIAAHKAYETREQKRRADGLESQLNELKNSRNVAVRPVIPSMPDAYEDNYEQQVFNRDEAIKNAALFDAQEQYQVNNKAYFERQEEIQEQQEISKISAEYNKNALKQGVDMNALGIAAGQISQYGLDEEVVLEMLADKDGPAITMYLASNPQLIDLLNDASSFSLGALYNDIKAKAIGKRKNIPNAPSPVDTFTGAGIPQKERGPAGATFE